MGLYRLILAYLVVYSHVGGTIYGYNPGVSAVISFLLLSGFVMTLLIGKYYCSLAEVPAFYLDRFARLAPQFYLYSALTLFGAVFLGVRHPYLFNVPSLWHTALQFAVLPGNLYRHFTGEHLLPQAWSLGLEALFYAVFPFVLIFRVRGIAAVLSFAVFLAAYGGLIDTDLYGFRYLPGTLFIFICGSWLASPDNKIDAAAPFMFCIIAVGLWVLTYIEPGFALGWSREVLLGIAVGIPIVYGLKVTRGRARYDELAGDLSYGVFLNHLLCWAWLTAFGFELHGKVGAIPIFVVATILSYFSFRLVETPFIQWRRKLRHRSFFLRPSSA